MRHWSTAARVALDLLPLLTAAPVESVLNVNSPDTAYEDLHGVRRGSLASGYASVTAIRAITEGPDVDLSTLEQLGPGAG